MIALQLQKKSTFLRQLAQDVLKNILQAVDSEKAVTQAVCLSDETLKIAEKTFPINKNTKFYSIALGKAAHSMARGLSKVFGERLIKGVVTCPNSDKKLPVQWEVFDGGHPLPNEQSLNAAKAAFDLLEEADNSESFIFFLISGGGSAMLEFPKDENITLTELQQANRYLVNCGATITEINTIRRRFSEVKGGGLSEAVTVAKQISLIISDTNSGEAFNVASGPTIFPQRDFSESEIEKIIQSYKLRENLPKSVFETIEKGKTNIKSPQNGNPPYFVLLENQQAVESAVKTLQENGVVVEVADDLVEAKIESGCVNLLSKLLKLRQSVSPEYPVGVVSGGEFVCPVRGNGIGGRNLESALRTAILFDEIKQHENLKDKNFVALFAGTDGIDGNSPAAGAIAIETTVSRARKINLNPLEFLSDSDSYSFFSALGDVILTKPTGTNVRDFRLLLAF